ncbi:Hypothetical predicted protein [Mytilus galloprovincialis]|uniref:Uncharacterized protein n=1 Tax=Mytilus galloprovincialis TaxID=29158 RepID=A0A8B6E9K6_MYTGA|nr:Hypothetical predicted protein [Mytilus galloprovincialis]
MVIGNADYSLLDMNPHTHKFEVVANYFGKDKEYKEVEGKHIHWAGGRTSAPPDTPKCGFDGSKCPPKNKSAELHRDNFIGLTSSEKVGYDILSMLR